jgi:hypothetical protein
MEWNACAPGLPDHEANRATATNRWTFLFGPLVRGEVFPSAPPQPPQARAMTPEQIAALMSAFGAGSLDQLVRIVGERAKQDGWERIIRQLDQERMQRERERDLQQEQERQQQKERRVVTHSGPWRSSCGGSCRGAGCPRGCSVG